MKAPEEPLVWPPDYPPTDWAKKFFIGVRWLGPDLRFFKYLRDQQAKRTAGHTALWLTQEERDVALIMGKHFQHCIGWRTPFFLPDDLLCTIAGGSSFDTDTMDFVDAIDAIGKQLGLAIGDQVWLDANDKPLAYIVRKIIQMQKEKAEPTSAAVSLPAPCPRYSVSQ